MAALVLAEFGSPEKMIEATAALREMGRTGLETYSPYPLDGTSEALGLRRSRVPLIVLIGGLFGAALGFVLQHWTNAIDYRINVGGRPASAAPAFVPITFELGVLLASLSAFFGLLFIYRLPKLWHPAEQVESFRSATLHGFWVSAAATDSKDADALMDRLRGLGAQHVSVVEEHP